MINLHFAFNINTSFDVIKSEEYSNVVERAYKPLLNCLRELGIKSTIFPTGNSLERLSNEFPDVIGLLKDLVQENLVEIGNHTYGHPIIPLISDFDFEKQIEFSQKIEKDLFGFHSNGFYPPEFCIDPTIPYYLKKNGLDWILLHCSNFMNCYDHQPEDIFKVGIMKGIKNSEMKVLTIYGDADEWIKGQLHGVFEGVLSPKKFSEDLTSRLLKETHKLDFTPNLILYTDSETPFFNQDSFNPHPLENFKRAIDYMLNNNSFRIVSASDIFNDKTTSDIEIKFKMRSTYKPFDIWTIGSEKLDYLINETRPLVYQVTKTKPNDFRVNEMWKFYLISQISDARSNFSERRLEVRKIGRQMRSGVHDRTLQAYDDIIQAKELALEILNG